MHLDYPYMAWLRIGGDVLPPLLQRAVPESPKGAAACSLGRQPQDPVSPHLQAPAGRRQLKALGYTLIRGDRMKFKVALYPSDEGFSVSVPGLPGCWSQGETEEEALSNIEDAIRAYLEVVSEQIQGAGVREI